MKQSFVTSFLTFWLKATVESSDNFIKISNPNTILKVIPLGSTNKTIPIEQLSSIDDSFKLDIVSFIWGIVFAIIGLGMMKNSFIDGLILTAYGILTVLSAFQTVMVFTMTSGVERRLSVICFQKSKLLSCKDMVEESISKRYSDTNVSSNTDRLIDNLNKK